MPPVPLVVLLATAGTALVAAGVAVAFRARRDPAGPLRPWLHLARGFRLVVIGGALYGIGVGAAAELGWVVAISIAIGLEELWEATFLTGALSWAERNGWPDRIEMPPYPRLGPAPARAD